MHAKPAHLHLPARIGAALVLAGLLSASASLADYPVVDTGQMVCYDNFGEITCPAPGEAFFGQDAQFDGNLPSYTLSGDGLTVHDNNTGLTWVQSPETNGDSTLDSDDKLTWADAMAFPATLNAQSFGGYNDWRVPTIKELYSLIDFSGTDPSGPDIVNLIPFIDTDYFDFAYGDESAGERIIDAQYWSSTQYVASGDQVFGVNFADGRIKGYGLMGPSGEMEQFIRCVRGDSYGANDFTDNEDGTITDNSTDLMWTQDDQGDGVSNGPRSGMIWEDALAWAEQKNAEDYLGYDDWRLPDAKELQSLVDYTRAPDVTGSAAIDPLFNVSGIFNEASQADYPWYWTGTTHAAADGTARSAVYVCFGRALGYFGPPGMESWVDVHGAGAQRSDIKDGDFSGLNYAYDGYYFGPQGDARRHYNYVRLVRDAGTSTGLSDDPDDPVDGATTGGRLPGAPTLHSVTPNPFNPTTRISFELPTSGPVRLRIFDLRGNLVRTLVDGFRAAGEHDLTWDGTSDSGRPLPSGTYLLRLDTEQRVVTRSATLVK